LEKVIFDLDYQRKIEERVFQEGMELKEAGTPFIGIYCAFTPREIILAAGCVSVSLCAGSQKPIETAEKHLPSNLCPLIKASYGHALEDSCPYFHFSDFLFADATCDGKKKMFELLGKIKPLHVLQLPQTYETDESIAQWLHELQKLKSILVRQTGRQISEQALSEQIKLLNKQRETVNTVFGLNKGQVPLLYGNEINIICDGGGFDCNIEKRIAEMEKAIAQVKERANDQAFINEVKNKPRILLTGCPTTNKKVLDVIEESGGIVVAMENCGGLKTAGDRVDEEMEPMMALAEHYIKIACPCMTPNQKRLDLIAGIVRDYRIDGVVELTWHGCHTYNVEAFLIKKCVNEQCQKPYIQIETDYMENDIEQIRVRIQAFLELLS
jgi:benzoyl-CoA reductase/2-hydroxyglutaryl-CoA dehydratase subunit BcrC/BadD/HgdB